MTYYMYIIQSESNGGFYIGHSHDVDLRVARHNLGWTRSTRGRGPWKLVYVEKFETKLDAIRREREIKKRKSREYICRLIKKAGCR